MQETGIANVVIVLASFFFIPLVGGMLIKSKTIIRISVVILLGEIAFVFFGMIFGASWGRFM